MKTIPLITVDLADHAKERWKGIPPIVLRSSSTMVKRVAKNVPVRVGTLLSVLTKWRNPYRSDVEALATETGIEFKSLLSLNFSYELASAQHAHAEHAVVTDIPVFDKIMNRIFSPGCTSGCRSDERLGMLHLRTLDWDIDGLGRNAVVFRFENGPAGVYYSVGWPGLVGVLTGHAPGRFCAAINFARSRKGLSLAWPPSHLLRHVFENCNTFDEAIRTLRDTEMCSPSFITVVGAHAGQAAIVECTHKGNRVFHMTNKRPIAVANDHLTGDWREQLDGLTDGTIRPDVCGKETAFFAPRRKTSMLTRLQASRPQSMTSALQILNARPLLNEGTKLQVAMSPTNGRIALYGIENRKRVSFRHIEG